MKYSSTAPVKILVIGAGGTGGYVIPHLYRLSYASGRAVRIIVCDGDIVEKKNLIRQNFVEQDVGRNKAQVQAERYSAAFGIECEYIPDFIESDDQLLKLTTPDFFANPRGNIPETQKVILLGCVDNNRSRQMCHRIFQQQQDLVYIDSGNGEHTGQVVCGVRQKGRTTYKPVGSLYPDILGEEDKFPSELSCAERTVSAPQSVTANLTAATSMIGFLYNLLIVGDLNTRYVTFSSRQINTRAEITKRRKPAKNKTAKSNAGKEEKAFASFEKLMNTQIQKAQETLEAKVVKKMNATSNDGTVYTNEQEIQEAYGYDMITEAERNRLLEALEYRNERPRLKEDYYIALCYGAIAVLNEAKGKVAKEERDRQRRDKAAQIIKAGNQPRYCYCCGEIIGEVLGGDTIGTKWYDNHAECARGHVCRSCLSGCVGLRRCDDRRNQL